MAPLARAHHGEARELVTDPKGTTPPKPRINQPKMHGGIWANAHLEHQPQT